MDKSTYQKEGIEYLLRQYNVPYNGDPVVRKVVTKKDTVDVMQDALDIAAVGIGIMNGKKREDQQTIANAVSVQIDEISEEKEKIEPAVDQYIRMVKQGQPILEAAKEMSMESEKLGVKFTKDDIEAFLMACQYPTEIEDQRLKQEAMKTDEEYIQAIFENPEQYGIEEEELEAHPEELIELSIQRFVEMGKSTQDLTKEQLSSRTFIKDFVPDEKVGELWCVQYLEGLINQDIEYEKAIQQLIVNTRAKGQSEEIENE